MSASHSTDPKLAEALAECERLREENRKLRGRLGIPRMETSDPLPSVSDMQGAVTSKSTPDGKVKLFRNLFRGREDVYAVRWEGRNGKAGYSPAYHRIWGTSFRNAPDKPKKYFPLHMAPMRPRIGPGRKLYAARPQPQRVHGCVLAPNQQCPRVSTSGEMTNGLNERASFRCMSNG
jgi:hypothetical protein